MFASRLPADYDDTDLARANVFPLRHDPFPFCSRRYPPEDLTMTLHLEAACRYGNIIERAAVLHGLLPSIIAGFGSRQSGWGLDLASAGPDGCTDFTPRRHRTRERPGTLPADGDGFARGLMQLDYDRHDIARARGWRDPEANVEAACQAVADHRSQLRRRTTLQGSGLLRAALAAFDCGFERVTHAARQGQDVDSPTSDRNYGRDILQRTSFFQAHGWD